MNRKFKSALSVLLVITMALSLGISAFAEETEGQEQPAVCTGSADANDCAADTHVGSCPKNVSVETPAAGAEQGQEQEQGQGQEQGQKQPSVCTGSADVADCTADTHVGSCPKNVSVETPAAGAEQEQGQEQPAVCTGSADVTDCAAATHIEGCQKFVKAEPATENESDEKAAVQARIDALPEKDDFAAMSEEDKAGVAAEYAAIMEALYKLCEAEGIEDIEELEGIDFEKLLALSDAISEYTAAPVADYVAWIGETGYETLEAAVNAALVGETTIIKLKEGKYTLYNKGATTAGKNLTFIGAGTAGTTWLIGPKTPDPAKFGTEYNSDYSFDGAGTVTFQNMTLQSGSVDYLGFVRSDITIVDNCIVEGKTFYWGYTSATFNNTTFICPPGDYALWTYSSPVMTFDGCTFNSSGKVINVYNEGGTPNVIVNFNNCTVNSSNSESLSVMNINDALVQSFTINFTGANTINGIKADGIAATDGSHASKAHGTANGLKTSEQATCSKLFEFNMKYGSGNNGKTTVNINGAPVWQNGAKVNHDYTDGQNNNAFDVTYSEWTVTDKGRTRTVKKLCKYCGYDEVYEETENKFVLNYNANDGTGSMTPDSRFGEGKLTVKANGFERDGYDFTGWNTAADGKGTAYKPGDALELTESLTLYAQWNKIVTYTVTYTDGVDNAVIFPDQVYSGLKRGDRTPGFDGVPECRGYRFVGWEPRVSQTVTGDAVYKAVWEKIAVWSYGPGKGVQTGDDANLALWAVLMLGAGAAAAGAGLYVRKRRRSK